MRGRIDDVGQQLVDGEFRGREPGEQRVVRERVGLPRGDWIEHAATIRLEPLEEQYDDARNVRTGHLVGRVVGRCVAKGAEIHTEYGVGSATLANVDEPTREELGQAAE